jgi:hypothetical protein
MNAVHDETKAVGANPSGDLYNKRGRIKLQRARQREATV